MKKHIFQFIIASLMTMLAITGYLKYPSLFELFENRINDLMMIARGETKGDSSIIIVDIDEKSLKELGQWPWSRNKIATILTNLTAYQIGIIGFDVVFAEPDNSSPKQVLEALGRSTEGVEDFDETLAFAIAQSPTIVGYVFSMQDDNITPAGNPKTESIIIEKNKPKNSLLIKPHRAILNLPIIQDNAYSNGYFNTIPDRDGIVRSIPMLVEYDGVLYPSLSLEMIRLALGIERLTVQYYNQGVESIQLGEITIPTDHFGRMLINFRGGQHQYRYISASDIYFKRVQPNEVAGKIALIGSSAAGILDLRSTPYDSVYPGVEVHANALDNLLNQNFIAKPEWTIGANVLSIILVILLSFIFLLIPNPLSSFSLLLGLNATLLYAHYYAMTVEGILFNTVIPFLSINILFLIGQGINYFFETKQKNRIKKKFAAKVSSAVVEEIINHTDDTILEGKEEEITIFFSDIRGFTSLSEKMGSAKELIALLNRYMTPMVDIITKEGGTVDKFIGDAIMAYWNAPVPVPFHADRALQASVKQFQSLNDLNDTLKADGLPTIDIGIGLNSGLSVVGEMGSTGRSDYTCIGDAVNLASRAEGLCKPYGAKIVLTEFTKKLLSRDDYIMRELDIVRVKGKEEPVAIFECAGNSTFTWETFSDHLEEYHEALTTYREGAFEKAHALFTILQATRSQTLYQLYLERCEHYLKHPPQNFDGVFTFQTK